ncbi:MAG: FAD-binding oxidoreductase [Tunicatimonas sp.]
MRKKSQKVAGWGNYPMVIARVASPKDTTAWQTSGHENSLVVRGLGRSYGDQSIDLEATIADTRRLNHLLSFDDETGVLVCQAGVSLADIITTFAPRGWFPVVNPGTKYVTVGGAIANDIHGKGHHRDGSFARYVRSFTILLASGDVVTASREESPDLFWANFGGLGLLGVILTVTLQLERIETTYYAQKAIRVGGLDHMLEALRAYDQHYRYSVAWINPQARNKRLGEGVLTVGNQAKLSDLPRKLHQQPLKVHENPRLQVPFFLPNFSLNPATLTVLNQLIFRMQNSSNPISHYDKFLFPLDFVHYWNRGYGARGFVQYQFVIPTESAAAIRPMLQTIAASKCLPFLNVLKKMGPSTHGGATLSFPQEGFTLAIDFPVTKHLTALAQTLDRMVLDAGGRVYLGKDALLDAATFRQMYPQCVDWLSVKARYDPENRFTSSLAKRLGLMTPI